MNATQIETMKQIGEQAFSAPPTDELSEVSHAYQSGELQDDRPASVLSGVQPMLSSEGVGVGADTNSASVTVRAHTRTRSSCAHAARARARTHALATAPPTALLEPCAQNGPLRRLPQHDDVGGVKSDPPQAVPRGAEPWAC